MCHSLPATQRSGGLGGCYSQVGTLKHRKSKASHTGAPSISLSQLGQSWEEGPGLPESSATILLCSLLSWLGTGKRWSWEVGRKMGAGEAVTPGSAPPPGRHCGHEVVKKGGSDLRIHQEPLLSHCCDAVICSA